MCKLDVVVTTQDFEGLHEANECDDVLFFLKLAAEAKQVSQAELQLEVGKLNLFYIFSNNTSNGIMRLINNGEHPHYDHVVMFRLFVFSLTCV